MGAKIIHVEVTGKDGAQAPEVLLRRLRVVARHQQPGRLRHGAPGRHDRRASARAGRRRRTS